jgi:hypothetical protein
MPSASPTHLVLPDSNTLAAYGEEHELLITVYWDRIHDNDLTKHKTGNSVRINYCREAVLLHVSIVTYHYHVDSR